MWPKDQLAEHRGAGTGKGTGANAVPAEAVLGRGRVRLATITMPAGERYVAFARLATGHLCGLLGLTLSRVADLRLAVGEACGQFLGTDGAGMLELSFEREPDTLRITVRGPVAGEWPDRAGLGWLVLDALVGDLRWELPDGHGGDAVGAIGFREPLAPDELPGDVLWLAAP